MKTLNNFTAAKSIRAQLNALNKTTEVMATIGQNIVAQLKHGNKNHLQTMIKELKNKDGSINRYAKDILMYVNYHDGIKVTYSKKKGEASVKGKPEAVYCYASFLEEKEKEKAKKRKDLEEEKATAPKKGSEPDLLVKAQKLAKSLNGYTLEQAKQIMLLAEQTLIKSIIAEQEKTEGNMEMQNLTVPFKEDLAS